MFLRIFTNPNDDGDEDISSSGSKPVGERKKSTRNIFLVPPLASSPSDFVAAPSFFAFSKTSNALRLGLDAFISSISSSVTSKSSIWTSKSGKLRTSLNSLGENFACATLRRPTMVTEFTFAFSKASNACDAISVSFNSSGERNKILTQSKVTFPTPTMTTFDPFFLFCNLSTISSCISLFRIGAADGNPLYQFTNCLAPYTPLNVSSFSICNFRSLSAAPCASTTPEYRSSNSFVDTRNPSPSSSFSLPTEPTFTFANNRTLSSLNKASNLFVTFFVAW